MELVSGQPNVELRRGADGAPIVVLAFPYDAHDRRRRAHDPPPAVRLGPARVVGARRRLVRRPRRRGPGPLPRADDDRRGRRLAGRPRAHVGRADHHRAPRRARLVRAAPARRDAARGRWPTRSRALDGALLAPLDAASAEAIDELGSARLDGPRAPLPGHAAARRRPAAREPARRARRRGRAPAPRRPVGPRRGRRVRPPAGRRRRRPRAAARPVGRASRWTPSSRSTASRSRRAPGPCSSACGPSTRRPRPRCAARGRRRPSRWRRSPPSWAASSRPTSGRACATRWTRGAPSWPTSRGWARPSRRWRRSRPTARSPRSSSARRRSSSTGSARRARWLPHRGVAVVEGRVAVPPTADVTILNYEIVAAHREALGRLRPRALVVDESHLVKNPQAKRTQAVRRLAEAVAPRRPAPGADGHARPQPRRGAGQPAARPGPPGRLRLGRAVQARVPRPAQRGAPALASAPALLRAAAEVRGAARSSRPSARSSCRSRSTTSATTAWPRTTSSPGCGSSRSTSPS